MSVGSKPLRLEGRIAELTPERAAAMDRSLLTRLAVARDTQFRESLLNCRHLQEVMVKMVHPGKSPSGKRTVQKPPPIAEKAWTLDRSLGATKTQAEKARMLSLVRSLGATKTQAEKARMLSRQTGKAIQQDRFSRLVASWERYRRAIGMDPTESPDCRKHGGRVKVLIETKGMEEDEGFKEYEEAKRAARGSDEDEEEIMSP